jgi:ribose transport system permease protein
MMVSDAGVATAPTTSAGRRAGEFARRLSVLIAFFLLLIFFAVFAPSFATPGNALNVVGQGVILTFCAMAMTLVITAGGIDLSIGVAFDFAAMAAVSLLVAHVPWPIAILGGLALGTSVGVFNAFMIVKVGISPFLATLAMLFIGESVQRIYTTGGAPIYVAVMDPVYRFLGNGKLGGGLLFSIVLAVVLCILMYVLIERMTHGRRWRALGQQPEAARIAGIRVNLYGSFAYIISAFVSSMAGIILSASLSSYVPISGGAYLMDAIGATFIGTALDPEGRPNVLGTILGVLFLGVLANGLNLIGINFYWQAVARGVLIFLALAIGALNRTRQS